MGGLRHTRASLINGLDDRAGDLRDVGFADRLMARWCHRCGRPKEGHDVEKVMVDTFRGTLPVNRRICDLKQVNTKRFKSGKDPYPIYRSVQAA
jgi:hypothetical protein